MVTSKPIISLLQPASYSSANTVSAGKIVGENIILLLLLLLSENFYLYHNLFKTNQSKKGLETDIILRNKEILNEPFDYLGKFVNKKKL